MDATEGLLERAIDYTLGCLLLADERQLARRTPCRDWDLRTLLAHLNDSLAALLEAAGSGSVPMRASEVDSAEVTDPVGCARERASTLLGAGMPATVWVADAAMPAGLVSGTGAVELAVHGWDVASACGYSRPIPGELAERMLRLTPVVVTGADRPERFAPPVPLPRGAPPGDRLIAFLGRHP